MLHANPGIDTGSMKSSRPETASELESCRKSPSGGLENASALRPSMPGKYEAPPCVQGTVPLPGGTVLASVRQSNASPKSSCAALSIT